jgi:hypothetical protein
MLSFLKQRRLASARRRWAKARAAEIVMFDIVGSQRLPGDYDARVKAETKRLMADRS